LNEKHKIDLIRNKIQESDFRSVDFHFALVEQDNIWRIFVSKIIFSKNHQNTPFYYTKFMARSIG